MILDRATHELKAWEGGDNRVMNIVPAHKHDALMVLGQRMVNPRPAWRCAGVAIPTFSVRTEEDFGVGDFFDLMKMVDWAVATGAEVPSDTPYQRYHDDPYVDRLLPLQRLLYFRASSHVYASGAARTS